MTTHTLDTLPDLPFTRRLASEWGIRPRHLTAAVRAGRVVRLLRGVYVRCDVEPSVLLRARAAVLVVNRSCIICDRSAAWIWGVDAFEYAELDRPPDLEVCSLRGHDTTDRVGIHGHSRELQPLDWVEIGDVKVTTPVRTAMDLGCLLHRPRALGAMDALMRLHGFTIAEMQSQLPRYFRRRGVLQLRELVPLVDGRSESQGESWARFEIKDHGLPAAEPNVWVLMDGVPRFRLDLAYRHARICVEYDGEEFHTSAEDRASDEARRRWLRAHGWYVIVLTKDSFTEAAVRAWVGELREQLAVRTRRPRAAYSRVARG